MRKFLFVLMAIIAFGMQNANAQDALKIITGHPDFKIKVTRCVANGKSVFLDLTLRNEGVNDIEEIKLSISTFGNRIVCYDDLGNIYEKDIFVKVANRQEYIDWETDWFKIPTGVPMRVSIRIDNFSTSAENIARISLPFQCSAWGLNSDKPVKIANVPIDRN